MRRTVRTPSEAEKQPGIRGWLAALADTSRVRAEQSGPNADRFGGPPTAGSEPGPILRVFSEPGFALPALAEAGGCRVIFDGTLYNRATLLGELDNREEAPNDAEVVRLAFLRWGDAAFAKLRGVFALVIWDRKRGILRAARDPLGTYSLYYAEVGPEFLLSTSADALAGHRGFSRSADRAVLGNALWHFWPRMADTYYASVKRVAPGHVLRIGDTERQVFRYWDPAPPHEPVRWVAEDAVGQFDALLEQAVTRCLTWGPAAIYLSGGLDSASIAAVAGDRSARDGLSPPLALSVVFPDPECNEEAVQTGVARMLGLPQVLTPFDDAVGPAGLIPAALEISRSAPFPLFNVWWPAYRSMAAEATRRGYRAILTGSGGDEWLTVSELVAADLVCRADVRGLFALWQNSRRSYQGGGLRLAEILLWRYGIRPLLTNALGASSIREGLARRLPLPNPVSNLIWPGTGPIMPTWLAPDPALRNLMREQVMTYQAAQRRINGFYLRDLRILIEDPVVAEANEDSFASGRRSGILQLYPFWDPDLVDFLYRIPPEVLVRQRASKGLVRNMLASRFPGLGFGQQKKVSALGFFGALSLKDGARVWRALGGTPALGDLGIVEPRALAREIEESLAQNHPRGTSRIWDVLRLEAWLQGHQ
ncbi:MAG TPA: asparagine synthase-related protein [Chloroflexota bacterium]|nr:asparagine synthase-related protein [Chloroflexota bacterium]